MMSGTPQSSGLGCKGLGIQHSGTEASFCVKSSNGSLLRLRICCTRPALSRMREDASQINSSTISTALHMKHLC